MNSENRGPFALWQLALYIAVLGVISVLLAPLSPLWWIVPLLGAAVPIAWAAVQGRQPTVADQTAPAVESRSRLEMAAGALQNEVVETAPHDATVLLPPSATLSEREIEVLAALASGKTNAEVATDLYISIGTVKSHSANIYRKLEAKNRTEAVARARELDLLP
jgi:DNA-binding NarL/FixJ family response regulator